MRILRDVLYGPWRAVPVLGITHVLAIGTMFYPVVLMVPIIAAERDWSVSFTMAGFSLGLLIAGCFAPYIGILIDRYGGHRIMSLGSVIGGLGLVGLACANTPVGYLAAWGVVGIAMAASLYDSAFATLGRIFGTQARRPITVLAIAAGISSTISWPVGYFLIESVGWRGTYHVYAGILVLAAAPLHFFALPRCRPPSVVRTLHSNSEVSAMSPTHGSTFVFVACAFAANAFIFSGLSAHLLAIFGRVSLDRDSVILAGALFGPAQIAARLCELMLGQDADALWIARFAIGILVVAFLLPIFFGLSIVTLAAIVVTSGVTNGLMSIARGTVPLTLFGAVGYAQLIGRIARPSLIMQAAAPLVLAFVVERGSDRAALIIIGGIAVIAFACLAAIRRPKNETLPHSTSPYGAHRCAAGSEAKSVASAQIVGLR